MGTTAMEAVTMAADSLVQDSPGHALRLTDSTVAHEDPHRADRDQTTDLELELELALALDLALDSEDRHPDEDHHLPGEGRLEDRRLDEDHRLVEEDQWDGPRRGVGLLRVMPMDILEMHRHRDAGAQMIRAWNGKWAT
jgi:hypothetical protein